MVEKKIFRLLLFASFLCFSSNIYSQQKSISPAGSDSAKITKQSPKNILAGKDSSLLQHSPRKATFRSAVLPGWGQAYNKKYWKIPIVYGALGTTAAVFFYNLKTYKALKQAYIYIVDTIESNDALIRSDLRNLSPESIRSYRNSFRQNIDYSVLFFLVFWGLNVVDATVDANLKAFDVSNDITLKVRPALNINSAGVGLVFSFKDKKDKPCKNLP